MTPTHTPTAENVNWQKVVAPFTEIDTRRSIWQIVNSMVPFFVLWYLMYLSLDVSYWLTLALALPTAGFVMRIFIIFHDCGHGSFLKSRKAQDILGIITGIIAFTPYYEWRHSHAVHHATSGDLDRRGIGDVWTLTVDEYLALPWYKQLGYRIYRQPLIMFGIGAPINFVILQRFTYGQKRKRERNSVYWTNLALLLLAVGLSALIGWQAFLMVQLPIIVIASITGVWLFYIQHQFEGTYWERHENWDYATAAMHGSSYYKLPRIFQWFSGNIGFHHVHHLSPRIPNYNLEACHNSSKMFLDIECITFWQSLRAATFRLWDEERQILVGYDQVKALQAQAAGT